MTKRLTNEEAANLAVIAYRNALIERISARRLAIHSGKVMPHDNMGNVIRKGSSVSINATAGANGELVRLLAELRKERDED